MDTDPQESAEWRDALASLLRSGGPERVREIMDMLPRRRATRPSAGSPQRGTPYVNTIPADRSSRRFPATWRSRSGWPR